jgi:gliding motility-associated-like protein
MIFKISKKWAVTAAIVIMASTLLCSVAQGQANPNQTAKVTPCCWPYSGGGFLQYLPPDYNSNTDKYPLMIFLHGLGEKGNGTTEIWRVAANGPPKIINGGYNFPFIVISPQLKSASADWYANYINEFVTWAKANLRIDETRIWITGLSLGGGGTWAYSEVYPTVIAAMAPICGHYNNPAAACTTYAANRVPIWMFHGDADPTINIGRSVDMYNKLIACVPTMTPAPIFTIYPGVGHNSWDRAYRTDHLYHNPNLYEWLQGKRKTSITINAGVDQNINLPLNSTSITGTASSSTGTITSYLWSQVSGTAITLTNPTTPVVSLTNLVAGVYVLRLTVTASTGETLTDDVKVTVIQTNQSPTANAGGDAGVTLPVSSLNITGSGSDNDGSISSYLWAKVSGPTATMGGTTTAVLSLTNLLAGTYVFSITVTDNLGATGSDQVTVVVNPAAVNQLPVANAGLDRTINLPTSTATLSGSGSDPDGTVTAYFWEKMSGSTITMTNTNTASLSLASLVAGVYSFRLTVTDNIGATANDLVTVTVIAANQSPVANAGSDVTITLPTNSTNMSGSASDADGIVSSWAWSQVSGPNTGTLTNQTTNTLTVASLIQGTYVFRMTVTDDKGATGFDDVNVIVNAAPVNVPPVSNAGADKNVTLPIASVIFNGNGTDTDGTISSYSWSLLSGPTVTLSNQNTKNLTTANLVAGSYTFRLTVTDNSGASAFDDVAMIVQPAVVNVPPVANAGGDITIKLPTSSASMTGSGSDSDGSISVYGWTQVSGPSTAVLTNQVTAVLTAASLIQGSYVFRLTVRDDKGATASDDVRVTVNALNTPPVAQAGSDNTITLPVATVQLTGAGTDSDGTVSTYQWTQVSGPGTATIASPTTAITDITNLSNGTYIFRLTVTDNESASSTDDVKITVNNANQAPVASAGAAKSITLPTTSANFSGFATDADGVISSYLWSQISGPSATLSNANTSSLSVVVTVEGSYTFRLTATDNAGATDFDDVILTVNAAAIDLPPVANAGSNKTITLPLNTVDLTGSGIDPEGSIVAYAWAVIGGSNSPTVTNATSATVTLSGLIEGNYTLRLTVTDAGGQSASSNTSVTVLPAAVNQVPVASAGSDQTITLPLNTMTLFGSGSDPDGSITQYLWSQTSGPSTTLSITNLPNLQLSALTAGTYVFSLTVTDNSGATGLDNVTVVVNPLATNEPPIANAGSDKSINLPTNITTLSGSGSDVDGSVTGYSWMKVSGPSITLGTTNQASLSLSGLVAGSYTFRLEVVDNLGLKATDDVVVTVLPATVNQSPVVSAGSDKVLTTPNSSAILNGSASDPDGSITTLIWTQLSGPSPATLANAATTSLSVNDLVEGIYTFRLSATDDKGASSSDDVTVTINAATVNQPPVANAGADLTLKLPTDVTATLAGAGFDTDGTITAFQWRKINGPALTTSDLTLATLTLSGLVEGVYTFRLMVTDDKGAISVEDEIVVTVLPASINLPPVVSAGSDGAIQLPAAGETIVGSASDDGAISTVLWEKVSGPAVTLSGQNTTNLSVTGLNVGVYIFKLTATDNTGLQSSDQVTLTVEAEPIVVPAPTVNAGEDVMIQLPVNTATLTATADSPNGLITGYQWLQTNGAPLTIPDDKLNTIELSNLMPGNYGFSVTVTDATNQSAKDDVALIVLDVEPIAKPQVFFSPDGKGEISSETWAIENAFLLDGCEIAVYNRQGQKVFSSVGYPKLWDGTLNGSGTALPEGAYFYTFKCPSQKSQTGSVSILRSK